MGLSIKFPNVTVCPPKDTFTDLNYDQMLAENTTLSDKERVELLEYAIEVLEESNYMNKLSSMGNHFKRI